MIRDEKLREIILQIVEKLKREYEPEKIVLYGSYAYGNPTEDSDIDLFIIKDTARGPIERDVEVRKLIDDPTRRISVSPRVYTHKEVEWRLSLGDDFVEEVLTKGEVLYESPSSKEFCFVRDESGREKLAEEWFVRGDNDLQTAKLAFEQGGPGYTIAILLQQAAEKYLKGYLVGRGWKLQKTHDVEALVREAMRHDEGFERFLDLAETVSKFYSGDRYPPGPPPDYPREEVAEILAQTEELVARIRGT